MYIQAIELRLWQLSHVRDQYKTQDDVQRDSAKRTMFTRVCIASHPSRWGHWCLDEDKEKEIEKLWT